ncbi:hypothetical protein TSMEX_011208 [Taenia solium]|eukprot:TsM_000989500 transcript=TsM_000989500 gene=TsM_000989500
MGENARDATVGALDNAVFELRVITSMAPNNTTTKVEMVDVTGTEIMGRLIRRSMNSSSGADETPSVYMSMEGTENAKAVVTTQDWLMQPFDDAMPLGKMVEHKRPYS